jgi:hypothetical protein
VTFTDVVAVTAESTGGLANPRWTVSALSLVPRAESSESIHVGVGDGDTATSPGPVTGGPGATPRWPSSDGRSFVVDWLPTT